MTHPAHCCGNWLQYIAMRFDCIRLNNSRNKNKNTYTLKYLFIEAGLSSYMHVCMLRCGPRLEYACWHGYLYGYCMAACCCRRVNAIRMVAVEWWRWLHRWLSGGGGAESTTVLRGFSKKKKTVLRAGHWCGLVAVLAGSVSTEVVEVVSATFRALVWQ